MLKLISVNIERTLHLDKITPFLTKENADVIAFQEILEDDFENFKRMLGMDGFFVPEVSFAAGPHAGKIEGIAFLSKHPIMKTHVEYYVGTPDLVPVSVRSQDLTKKSHTTNNMVIGIEIGYEGNLYRIFVTHMPVTFEGVITDFQIDAVDKVLAFLGKFDELIFCGDLNAPRGRESFGRFAQAYIDVIPASYDNSLDPKIHRNPKIDLMKFMVDGLFITPNYRAENVRLQDGVSDHMAVVAEIGKA